jgi:G3E family GTPase
VIISMQIQHNALNLRRPTMVRHMDFVHHDHGSGPVLSMAHMQISHADVVILNKTDLVTE